MRTEQAVYTVNPTRNCNIIIVVTRVIQIDYVRYDTDRQILIFYKNYQSRA